MEGIPAASAAVAAAAATTTFDPAVQQQHRMRRKRKADTQDTNNERLSKRLSLLNLEQNGQKLYVPVENPNAQPTPPLPTGAASALPHSVPPAPGARRRPPAAAGRDDSMMQLDDSKYKVYIYNIDDELSSSDGEAAGSDGEEGGRLVFLPDIERHLRANRIGPSIPPPVPPSPEGELAGMQLVLYGVPSSLSVPEEHDSVRKAIIEARARHREKLLHDRQGPGSGPAASGAEAPGVGGEAQQPPVSAFRPIQLDAIPEVPNAAAGAGYLNTNTWSDPGQEVGEADAMDID